MIGSAISGEAGGQSPATTKNQDIAGGNGVGGNQPEPDALKERAEALLRTLRNSRQEIVMEVWLLRAPLASQGPTLFHSIDGVHAVVYHRLFLRLCNAGVMSL